MNGLPESIEWREEEHKRILSKKEQGSREAKKKRRREEREEEEKEKGKEEKDKKERRNRHGKKETKEEKGKKKRKEKIFCKTTKLPSLTGGCEYSRIDPTQPVKHTGKESLQWGLAAGVYSGLTYGLTEARGAHDWKNSAVAGAITGVALALTSEGSSHEQIVQGAITGAAISTAANLLSGIF
ncbi:unnamed protein product [Prunus armeniaca]|uniref:Uncharacterized protein n=1 Tax=Prunus armeniaca TaxID=36596 RepID=A0A6J5W016_PRUAR|nr:unnamed protein product [Prunus armeniaca]